MFGAQSRSEIPGRWPKVTSQRFSLIHCLKILLHLSVPMKALFGLHKGEAANLWRLSQCRASKKQKKCPNAPPSDRASFHCLCSGRCVVYQPVPSAELVCSCCAEMECGRAKPHSAIKAKQEDSHLDAQVLNNWPQKVLGVSTWDVTSLSNQSRCPSGVSTCRDPVGLSLLSAEAVTRVSCCRHFATKQRKLGFRWQKKSSASQVSFTTSHNSSRDNSDNLQSSELNQRCLTLLHVNLWRDWRTFSSTWFETSVFRVVTVLKITSLHGRSCCHGTTGNPGGRRSCLQAKIACDSSTSDTRWTQLHVWYALVCKPLFAVGVLCSNKRIMEQISQEKPQHDGSTESSARTRCANCHNLFAEHFFVVRSNRWLQRPNLRCQHMLCSLQTSAKAVVVKLLSGIWKRFFQLWELHNKLMQALKTCALLLSPSRLSLLFRLHLLLWIWREQQDFHPSPSRKPCVVLGRCCVPLQRFCSGWKLTQELPKMASKFSQMNLSGGFEPVKSWPDVTLEHVKKVEFSHQNQLSVLQAIIGCFACLAALIVRQCPNLPVVWSRAFWSACASSVLDQTGLR